MSNDLEHSQPRSPCMIRVVVREHSRTGDAPSEPIHDQIGDYNARHFRDWMSKTEWWAMKNGKHMSMSPA